MNRRDGAIIAVLVLLLAVLGGAVAAPAFAPLPTPAPSHTPVPVAVHREGILGSPSSINPVTARTAADRDLVALLFRGLVRLGPDGDLLPDLASSWTVDPTGAHWTFVMNPDASWDDGQAVTSADVVFTVHVLQDPAIDSPLAAGWQGVTATAVDPHTVRLDLGTPLGGFLQAATQPLLPSHLLAGTPIADIADSAYSKNPVGDGAFRLVSVDDQRAILEPATTAGATPSSSVPPSAAAAGEPLLARLELDFYASADALASAYRAGKVDAAAGLPPADAVALGAGPGSRLLRYPGVTLTMVALNLRPGHPAFTDKRVRRALLAAIDREAFVATDLAGLGTVADTVIPPSSWAYDGSATTRVAHDPAAAAAALKAAGWRQQGSGWLPKSAKKALTIEILAPAESANPTANAAAVRVAAAWTALGIPSHVTSLAPGAFVDRIRNGEFAAAVLDINVGLDPDPYPFLASSQARTGGSNVAGIQDAGLDKALGTARAPAAMAKRLASYKALQTLLGSLEPVLPLAFHDMAFVVSNRLAGPTPRPIADLSGRFWDVLTWRLAGG